MASFNGIHLSFSGFLLYLICTTLFFFRDLVQLSLNMQNKQVLLVIKPKQMFLFPSYQSSHLQLALCIAKQRMWDKCKDSVLLAEGELFKCEGHPLGSLKSRAKIAISLTHSLCLQIFHIKVSGTYLKAILELGAFGR